MALDAVTVQAALGSGGPSTVGPQGEVWATYSEVSGVRYAYLFVADLAEDWIVYPRHLGYENGEFWGYESNSTDKLFYFSNDEPLLLKVS